MQSSRDPSGICKKPVETNADVHGDGCRYRRATAGGEGRGGWEREGWQGRAKYKVPTRERLELHVGAVHDNRLRARQLKDGELRHPSDSEACVIPITSSIYQYIARQQWKLEVKNRANRDDARLSIIGVRALVWYGWRV